MQKSPVKPTVGMGATMLMHSDRHAYTIVEVVSDKEVVVQQDNAVRTDKNGLSESQTYEYSPNPQGEKHTVTLRKHGGWVTKKGHQRWHIGERREYRDPSF